MSQTDEHIQVMKTHKGTIERHANIHCTLWPQHFLSYRSCRVRGPGHRTSSQHSSNAKRSHRQATSSARSSRGWSPSFGLLMLTPFLVETLILKCPLKITGGSHEAMSSQHTAYVGGWLCILQAECSMTACDKSETGGHSARLAEGYGAPDSPRCSGAPPLVVTQGERHRRSPCKGEQKPPFLRVHRPVLSNQVSSLCLNEFGWDFRSSCFTT